MTAFAAAARTLFTDPNGSVAGVYAASAGGAGQSVRVVIARTDPEQFLGGATAHHPGLAVRLLRREIAAKPPVGATITIAAGDFAGTHTNQATTEDALNLEWILDCR